MLAFLMTIADEQYRSQIDRLYKRYHQKMLRMATNAFSAAKRNNPGLDAEDAACNREPSPVTHWYGRVLSISHSKL